MRKIRLFTEEDKELLKMPIPHSPCINCSMGFSCYGCQQQHEYNHTVEKYKESGIFQYALNIQQILDKKEKISDLELEIKNTINDFPEEIRYIAKDMANCKHNKELSLKGEQS